MTDWSSWRKHVEYVINTRGRWYGLGDGDGAPLATLPEPESDFAWPEQWQSIEDIQMTLPAEGEWYDRLIGDGLTGFSIDGKLGLVTGDYTVLYATRGENGKTVRRAGVVTHALSEDPDNTGGGVTITISALGTGDVWNTIPAISWPSSWWKADPYPRTTDESMIDYEQPWNMARIEMATRTSYVNKYGQAAFVVRRLVQESLDAAMSTQKDPDGTIWVDDPFHVVEVPDETDMSPNIALEARDGQLWETVQAQAQAAGIQLGARVWWPGDDPIRCWTPVTSSTPGPEVDITPDDGSPSVRTLEERTFPHAMIVVEVTYHG